MRHKQQPMGIFSADRQDHKHGTTHGYKVHGCRCEPCKAAMSAYGKSRRVLTVQGVKTAPTPSSSFWIGKAREGFTASVEKDHLQRMRDSRYGSIQGKPYSTGEVSR